MATMSLSSFSAVLLSRPSQISNKPSRCFFFKPLLLTSSRSPSLSSSSNYTSPAQVRASSTAIVETEPDSILDAKEVSSSKKILACPICYNQLIWNGDHVTSADSAARSSFQCNTCKKAYCGNETHIDLIVASGAKEYGEVMAPATEFFRFPLISFLYERGWRQSFSLGGFPDQEKEFELIKDHLKPVLGGNIVDASCGSGLFSRLFAKSGLFSLVVALDFSENMLQQCHEYVKQEENFPKENLMLVRADISRLPFASSSIDAVHAGAALHCWPSPSTAVAEISRILRPGGVFVATTYVLDGPFAALPLLKSLSQNFGRISGSHIFLADSELEELCNACGLVDFKCDRNRRFVMISATKPS
ncbi:putative methyltransferase [Camellia lanceoleosa]|uniref:Methyltransferase n=1 Tax=Camellia lanceoleosa TaxID=1840588 RepID=A0ACC0GS70_9ERIC|nr:putative methyltransferase [Camellia lanceoleosa]